MDVGVRKSPSLPIAAGVVALLVLAFAIGHFVGAATPLQVGYDEGYKEFRVNLKAHLAQGHRLNIDEFTLQALPGGLFVYSPYCQDCHKPGEYRHKE